MSVQTLKRFFIVAAVALLAAQTVVAGGPSARSGARAVFVESTETGLMFGGLTATDAATGNPYALNETWAWDGTRWIRRYPANVPPARFSHAMVYDAARDQVVLFGGRNIDNEFADTWVYKNNNWQQVETSGGPEKRALPAMAFDQSTGRVVLYGGQRLSEDKKSIEHFYDYWEFDGSQWRRLPSSDPQVQTPILVYDEAREQLLLLGHDDKLKTLMYRWNPDIDSWIQLTPALLPPCVNESAAVYIRSEEKVFLTGGVCVPEDPTQSSPVTEDIYKWDGTNWVKVTDVLLISRGSNVALLYDTARDVTVMFGGLTAYTAVPRSATIAFSAGNWSFPEDLSSPGPRSLYALAADTENNLIYMYGGIGDSDVYRDFWKFEDGIWKEIVAENSPGADCVHPVGAFDKDRDKLVIVCGNSSVFEWDGSAWKTFTDVKTVPTQRRFSSMVYDETIRKTVLFGGLDLSNVYQNKTWTWDGTKWTEVKKKRPTARSLTSMWYDPISRKTVMFGGIGRRTPDGRIARYDDMWSFDGNGWTELKPATRPSTRYGAAVAVDRQSNRAILFGGLRLEIDENKIQRQVYANDTWEWDGQTWRLVTTENAATPRENAAMEFYAPTGELVLFGGWSGYYLADTWVYNDGKWRVLAE